MSKRVYWLWLSTRPGLNAAMIRTLTESFGTPEFLYGADRNTLLTAGLNQRQTDALCDKDLTHAQHIISVCDTQKIQIITIEDSAYPGLLREIADPPVVLYVKGNLPDLDDAPVISIVGTRACSAYGLRMAERFGAALAKAGFTIVSGMALGVDAAAHRGCLKVDGRTIAVLAGGVDTCYPFENRYLKGDIMLAGAVISENPPGTPNEGFRFPVRNRIISGMSVATLVIEAPAHSGALITARTAFEQGREVFAVPGPLDVSSSAGCNRLIRDEIARIVTDPMDIVHELAPMLREPPQQALIDHVWLRETNGFAYEPVVPYRIEFGQAESSKQAKPKKQDLLEGFSGEELQVAQAIYEGADTVDAISEHTNLSASSVSAILILLELAGVIEQKAGHCRILINKI